MTRTQCEATRWTQPEPSLRTQQAEPASSCLSSSIAASRFKSTLMHGEYLAPRCIKSIWNKSLFTWACNTQWWTNCFCKLSSNTLCVRRRKTKTKQNPIAVTHCVSSGGKKEEEKSKSQNELASAAGLLPAASTIFIKQLCQEMF